MPRFFGKEHECGEHNGEEEGERIHQKSESGKVERIAVLLLKLENISPTSNQYSLLTGRKSVLNDA